MRKKIPLYTDLVIPRLCFFLCRKPYTQAADFVALEPEKTPVQWVVANSPDSIYMWGAIKRPRPTETTMSSTIETQLERQAGARLYREHHFDLLVSLGRDRLVYLASRVKALGGKHSEHNLSILRDAWKAAPAQPELVARAVAAVEAAKAIDYPGRAWRESLDDAERAHGGEGRGGNYDCV